MSTFAPAKSVMVPVGRNLQGGASLTPLRSEWQVEIVDGDLDGLLFVRGDEAYRANGTALEKSTDYGETWSEIEDFAPSRPNMAWKHTRDASKTYTLVWVGADAGPNTPQTLYRSTDDATFTSVLSDASLRLPYSPWGSVSGNRGLNSLGFIDYGDGTQDTRVWNCNDNGVTWTNSLTISSANVRHGHSITQSPYNNLWYCTTGDSNSQVKWYKSNTFNPTSSANWAELSSAGTQRHRNGMLHWMASDELLFSADAVDTDAGIYTIDPTDLSTITRVVGLPDASVGLLVYGERMVAATYTATTTVVPIGTLFASVDSGATWTRIYEYPVSTSPRGFFKALGIDDQGRMYFSMYGETTIARVSLV